MSGSERLAETLQRIGMESIAALEKSHEAREAGLTNSRKRHSALIPGDSRGPPRRIRRRERIVRPPPGKH